MRDPYTVLGLSKSASMDDIKKSFRKLAKRYHPDQNKTDKNAKELFTEANQAYEILGDENKRAQFDRGEIDAAGKPRAPQFEGFGFNQRAERGTGFAGGGFGFDMGNFGAGAGRSYVDPNDVFADLFGGQRTRSQQARAHFRGEDISATTTIPLSDAIKGGVARVTLPTGRTLEVRIPPRFQEGKQIRLKGQGQPGIAGGESGDALITVTFAKHPNFSLRGNDLLLDLPITLYEAALGAKIQVPTIDGAVEMSLPPHTNNGMILRLRGKGLPATIDAPAGDLLVTTRIQMPETIDPELENFIKQWGTKFPYSPRKNIKL